MELVNIRHRWPEPAGFHLIRPTGARESVLLHFQTPVTLTARGQVYAIRPNTLILYAPDERQEFFAEERLVHDWMHIAGDVQGALAALGLEMGRPYSLSQGARVSMLVAQMEHEFFAARLGRDALLDAKLNELFVTVGRDASGGERLLPEDMLARLRAARGRMLETPEQPWPVRALSRIASVSESRLYPLYKSAFGITPNRDLILMRVEKAKHLLLQGLSVGEVAERLGYQSVYHFIRQFKAAVGVTPGQYTL